MAGAAAAAAAAGVGAAATTAGAASVSSLQSGTIVSLSGKVFFRKSVNFIIYSVVLHKIIYSR